MGRSAHDAKNQCESLVRNILNTYQFDFAEQTEKIFGLNSQLKICLLFQTFMESLVIIHVFWRIWWASPVSRWKKNDNASFQSKPLTADEKTYMKNDEGIFKYWVGQLDVWTIFASVFLRFNGMPASSASN